MTDTGTQQDLTWLLTNLVESVPHAHSALLVSGDGILKYVHGLDRDTAERAAASASGMCGIARGMGQVLGHSDEVRHLTVQVGELAVFLTTPSSGTTLVVAADPKVHAATLSHEMLQLGKQITAHLATPARHYGTAGGL